MRNPLHQQGLAGVVSIGLLLPELHTDCTSSNIKPTLEQANHPDRSHLCQLFQLSAFRYQQKRLRVPHTNIIHNHWGNNNYEL